MSSLTIPTKEPLPRLGCGAQASGAAGIGVTTGGIRPAAKQDEAEPRADAGCGAAAGTTSASASSRTMGRTDLRITGRCRRC